MSEWPPSVFSLRPPNFELEAVDGLTANEEVEDLRFELVLEGTVAPRAPTVASPWVLSPSNVAVAAAIVVDILGVAVDAVVAAGKQDEEGDKAIMASKLPSSQLLPSSCIAVLAPMVSSPGMPLPTAPPKPPFRAPPQLQD